MGSPTLAQNVFSLSKKLVFAVVMTSTIATFLSSSAQLFFEYRAAEEDINSGLEVFEHSTVESIRNLVWTFNEEALRQQLSASLQAREYLEIAVFGEDGEKIAEQKKQEIHSNVERPTFSLLSPDEAKRTIGRIELKYTKDYIFERLWHRALEIVATNFAKTLLVSVILMLIIANMVVRPLKALENAVSAKEFGKRSGVSVALPSRFLGKRTDELDVLAERIDVAQQSLLATITKTEVERHSAQTALQSVQDCAVKNQRLIETGTLAAGIAHEILTPLTSISLHSNKIRNRMEKNPLSPEELVRTLDRIDGGVSRISGIIAGMKSLARDGANDPYASVSIDLLFKDVENVVANSIGNSGLTVEFNNAAQGATISCRFVQIAQVFTSLINNSVDAVESLSERWIRVEAKEVNGWIEISVTDAGKGIDPAVVEKLFMPFYTTKEPGKGTGLGLSVAKSICEHHDGTLEVNHECLNTQFIVRLPRVKENADAA